MPEGGRACVSGFVVQCVMKAWVEGLWLVVVVRGLCGWLWLFWEGMQAALNDASPAQFTCMHACCQLG